MNGGGGGAGSFRSLECLGLRRGFSRSGLSVTLWYAVDCLEILTKRGEERTTILPRICLSMP
jgi:hypothetical protein